MSAAAGPDQGSRRRSTLDRHARRDRDVRSTREFARLPPPRSGRCCATRSGRAPAPSPDGGLRGRRVCLSLARPSAPAAAAQPAPAQAAAGVKRVSPSARARARTLRSRPSVGDRRCWPRSGRSAPRLGLVDAYFLPPLSEVLAAWWDLVVSGQLCEHAAGQPVRSPTGFVLAIAVADPAGAAIAWYRPVRRAPHPAAGAVPQHRGPGPAPGVRADPRASARPRRSRSSLYACFFPILLNTISRRAHRRPAAVRSARVAGALAGPTVPEGGPPGRGARPSSPASGSPAPPRSWC